MRKRIFLLGVLVLITVAITGWALFHAYFVADFAPPDDADLMPSRVDVPEDRNGATYFSLAREQLRLPKRGEPFMREWWVLWRREAKYNGEMAEYLWVRNEEVFRLVDKGLKCEVVQFPELSYDTWRLRLSAFLSVGDLANLHARHLLKTGKEEECFQELLRAMRLAHKISGSGAGTHTYSEGIGMKLRTLHVLREAASEASLTKDELLTLSANLSGFGAQPDAVAEALRAEYAMWKEAMAGIESGEVDLSALLEGPPLPVGFKPNKTLHLFAESYRLMLQIVRVDRQEAQQLSALHPPMPSDLHYRTSSNASFAEYWKNPQLMRYVYGNALGAAFYVAVSSGGFYLQGVYAEDDVICSLRGFRQALAEENVALAATRLLLALKGYKLDHGKLPDSLDALVPGYIEAVPIDDFDGEPMRYSKEKRVIYSVGYDLKDNGGGDEEKDIIYKIGF